MIFDTLIEVIVRACRLVFHLLTYGLIDFLFEGTGRLIWRAFGRRQIDDFVAIVTGLLFWIAVVALVIACL
ncbi:hypothetical protein E9531_02165 [Lampropedia puyangensis]|uniref:Uncharacterized protein n=1 Tax=Lampropedia puyangensis TaxID=1330072 RepID=A0A4S8FCN6_9BURK|nr:hypothetical protein [Lampropedia puyangensis]THU05363.1 hypothetical protein E9531_02165 [Lampropedia puyangensis]